MPPQQTNLILETAPPIAPVAAPDAAPSNPNTIQQAAASARPASSFLRRCWQAFRQWRRRRQLRDSLHDLSDRALADIGLTRGDIGEFSINPLIDARSGATATFLWITFRGMS